MSDAEVDPLHIETNQDDAKNCSDDEYLNSVKKFLALSSVSDDSDNHSESDSSKQNTSRRTTSTLRRSSRMSTSLYKDYSHVTSFEALPSIKLTLNLRNLPKCKISDNANIAKKSRKHKKAEKQEAAISTEELKQILEEVSECPKECPGDNVTNTSMHKTNTKLTKPNKSKGAREQSETKPSKNKKHKPKVLPKTKKKRAQTEVSKKLQKLKKACRTRYSCKEYASHKSTIIDKPQDDQFDAAPLLPLEEIKDVEKPTFIQEIENQSAKSVIVENVIDKNLQREDIQNNNETETNDSNKDVNDNSFSTPATTNKTTIGKHNLPVIVPERRSSIAEPLHNIAKIANCETKTANKTLDDTVNLESTLPSVQNETEMIYVKSPEALNETVQTQLPTHNETETTNSIYIEDISNQSCDDTSVQDINLERQCELHVEPTDKPQRNEVTCESNPCSEYVGSNRRNTISTSDLFGYPSMALKRAISTGILQRVASPAMGYNLSLQNKTSVDVEGPAAKRQRDNSYTQSNFHALAANHLNSPESPKAVVTTSPTHSIYQTQPTDLSYHIRQDPFNLARLYYGRLPNPNMLMNNETPKPSTSATNKPDSIYSSAGNVAGFQTDESSNRFTQVPAVLRDKSSKMYVTQCHPLNASKSSIMLTHEQVPSNTPTNIYDEGVTGITKVGIPKTSYNDESMNSSNNPSRLTSPLTISDSSSAADTDIELEVDVVGNDGVDDKANATYSKIIIKQKPELSLKSSVEQEPASKTPPISSPSPTITSNDVIEEIRKLRNVVELLLEHASAKCSEKDLQQIRQAVRSTTKAAYNLKINQLHTTTSHKSKTGDAEPVTNPVGADKNNMTPPKKMPRSTNAITKYNQVRKAVQDVLTDASREISRPPIPVDGPKNSSQLYPNIITQQSYHPISKNLQPNNPYQVQASDNYAKNYYAHANNYHEPKLKKSRIISAEQILDQSTTINELTKIMNIGKDAKVHPPQEVYLKNRVPSQVSQSHMKYKAIQPKPTIHASTIISSQERPAINTPISERPVVIYTTNFSPRNAITNLTEYPHTVTTSLYEQLYVPKDRSKRSTSIDELSGRSPDSGYISPARKISPRLEQNSIYDAIDAIKALPLTTTISKITPNLNITEQQNTIERIQQILPKLHHCGTLTPEQYVKEMYILEKEHCPLHLFHFYSYVTKKQISSNQLPIGFKIFLEFKSAGKLRMYENTFAVYMKKREQELYIKRR